MEVDGVVSDMHANWMRHEPRVIFPVARRAATQADVLTAARAASMMLEAQIVFAGRFFKTKYGMSSGTGSPERNELLVADAI